MTRLLEDMLELKKKSTEVHLAAGIRSPTEELRRDFLDLARTDKEHADILRDLLGIRLPKGEIPHLDEPETVKQRRPQAGPFPPGTLSGKVQEAVEDSRSQGHEPARIILSSVAFRHLRDEGAVEPRQGNVFGLPTDVDFSWQGEAFAVTSRDQISLSEIVTEMTGTEPPVEKRQSKHHPPA